eukprot:CAMPEP_0183295040 /NCGR_PEP_ID=MMETSP0160_2-20130417/3149_1 /TAXON_ID=2839 ORGANISM="Odontella Sinensis, Strain Grunow 1884" /NCGR_SAMPLE_ID=MMETSP0160_2 /ASSEMBLY_ACC=CAM_ASM_000250 /LENGTH=133 /DNA_ID=CAMNT_0025456457 /DNA_START=121 /DNA_END=522 /DNA_ORIENTATION=+
MREEIIAPIARVDTCKEFVLESSSAPPVLPIESGVIDAVLLGSFSHMAVSPKSSVSFSLTAKPFKSTLLLKESRGSFDSSESRDFSESCTSSGDPVGAAVGDFVGFLNTVGVFVGFGGTVGSSVGASVGELMG